MKIIIINGSPRKNGSTAKMLSIVSNYLKKKEDVEIEYFHLDDMEMVPCKGCCQCFKSGQCFMDDDAEHLSLLLPKADAIIVGSPTYASNLSGQLKTFVDRGHLVIEQSLYGKYAMGIITGENYGASTAAKILRNIFGYSGAFVSSHLIFKVPFSSTPNIGQKIERLLMKSAEHLYKDVKTKRTYVIQKAVHKVVFRVGIRPFVLKKGVNYQGVLEHWKERKCGPRD